MMRLVVAHFECFQFLRNPRKPKSEQAKKWHNLKFITDQCFHNMENRQLI